MQINLTEQQAQVLINLIDVAVKAAGLQAAEAGTFFSKLINDAAARENPQNIEGSAVESAESQSQA